MIFRFLSFILVATLGCELAYTGEATNERFAPAIYIPPDMVQLRMQQPSQILVFPRGRPPVSIALPVVFTTTAFSPDGLALYGVPIAGSLSHLARFDFKTRTLQPMDGITGFQHISAVAVKAHQSGLVVSGWHSEPGGAVCGLYDVEFPTYAVRRIFQREDCSLPSPTEELTLSPDGSHAVVRWDGKIWILDLHSGQKTALPVPADYAFYAPDGRSIAIGQSGKVHNQIVLVNPEGATLRNLGGYSLGLRVAWSPDSAGILTEEGCFLGYWGSLVQIDSKTGKHDAVHGTHCKIGRGILGWVAAEVATD